MFGHRTVGRLFRHVAIAVASCSVLLAGASYALSSVSDAIAATVTSFTSSGHGSVIEGRIVEGKTGAFGVKVEIIGRVKVDDHGTWVTKRGVVGLKMLGTGGKFSFAVAPGSYVVEIKDGSKASKNLKVHVANGKSLFVAGKLVSHSGGLSIVPVVFNY